MTGKVGKVLLAILWTTLGLVVAAYVGASVFFMSHFTMGSTLNGVDVSYKNSAQALVKLTASASHYSLTLNGNNGKSSVLSQKELGLTTNIQKSAIDNVLKSQNGFLWFNSLFDAPAYTVDSAINCDEATIKSAISGLACVKSTGKESVDAHVEFRSGEFEIVKEEIGDIVDEKALIEAIVDAATNLSSELNMEEASCYNPPKVFADDERLVKCKDELNKNVTTKFVYTVGDEKEEITAAMKSKWFTVDEQFNVSLDEEQVSEFLSDMAKKYNTVGQQKKVHSTTLDQDVMIPAGWYGWKIDKSAEFEQLVADLTSGKDVSRDFIYSQSAASRGDKDYGNSYVEVDLTAQHVYIYKKGEMVFDTACVTGNVLNFCDTHEGAYSIVYKQKDRILRGPDYETPVDNWMPFHNGEGLHDANWRGSFGGTIYQGSGSHGCVNLPPSAANKIYDLVEAGMPVLVFYTGNTRNEVAVMQNFISKVNEIETAEDKAAAIYSAMNAYGSIPEALRPKVNSQLATLEWYKGIYGVW